MAHPPPDQPWITVAHLLRPQGRKGELLAELHTDFPESLPGRRVFLQIASAEPRPAQITAHWLPVGKNAGRVVLKFAGVDSIHDAEALGGADVVVPAAERLPLTDGSVYISDLIGCAVSDAGRPIGVVAAVDLPTASDGVTQLQEAAPILTVRAADGNEHLIPFVQAYLTRLDPAAKLLDMTLPKGLLDLNETQP